MPEVYDVVDCTVDDLKEIVTTDDDRKPLWPPVLCEKLCYVWDEPGQVAGDEDAYDDDGYPGETDVPFPQGLCPTAPGAGVTPQLFSRPVRSLAVCLPSIGSFGLQVVETVVPKRSVDEAIEDC